MLPKNSKCINQRSVFDAMFDAMAGAPYNQVVLVKFEGKIERFHYQSVNDARHAASCFRSAGLTAFHLKRKALK
jgi:hypothetical protein